MAYQKDQWMTSFEGQLAILRPHLTQRVLTTMALQAWHRHGTTDPIQAARQGDPLLPTAQLAQIRVETRQDGRALHLSVTSSSDMVVSTVSLRCFSTPALDDPPPELREHCDPLGLKEIAAQAVKNARPKTAPAERVPSRPLNDYRCNRYTHAEAPMPVHWPTFEVKLLPGKSVRLYDEVNSGVTVQQCSLAEARGREKRWTDF